LNDKNKGKQKRPGKEMSRLGTHRIASEYFQRSGGRQISGGKSASGKGAFPNKGKNLSEGGDGQLSPAEPGTDAALCHNLGGRESTTIEAFV